MLQRVASVGRRAFRSVSASPAGANGFCTRRPAWEEGDPQLPFFVYGTLMQGFENHDVRLGDFDIDVQPAVLRSRAADSASVEPCEAAAAPSRLACGRLSLAEAAPSWSQVHFKHGFPGIYMTDRLQPSEDAALDNFLQRAAAAHSGVPGLASSDIVGELVTVTGFSERPRRAPFAPVALGASPYEYAVAALDELEQSVSPLSFRNLYERVEVAVSIAGSDKPVQAWTYMCMLPLQKEPHLRVPHGDWRRWVRETGHAPASGDWAESAQAAAGQR